jgi:hypothetical protein
MANAFRLEELDGAIALLTFDVPEQGVNTFSGPVMTELDRLVDQLAARKDLRGLLLKSGKRGQFIAGADLKEMGALAFATKEQVLPALKAGHEVFGRVSRLPFPTVALIDGNCMGGGTEITLAMDYRLAADNSSTKIGLPEVKVGIIPGWGGTQRLPRVVGRADRRLRGGEVRFGVRCRAARTPRRRGPPPNRLRSSIGRMDGVATQERAAAWTQRRSVELCLRRVGRSRARRDKGPVSRTVGGPASDERGDQSTVGRRSGN